MIDKIERMYESKDFYVLYNRFLAESGREPIRENAKVIPYEDVYPLLYLKHLLYGSVKRSGIKHLIVDEMQDYSYMQFLVLSKMFDCPMTILGDREQQAAPGKLDTQTLCKEIFGKEAKLLTLKKSYRSTSQITRFANRIAGIENEEAFERPGKEPEWILSKNESEMQMKIIEKLTNGQNDGFETTAILTTTEEQAERLYVALKDRLDVHMLSPNSSKMEKGIVITTFYLAKGLEFDSVHVAYTPLEEKLTEYQRQILYIGATRALHELTIYSIK